jgi:hypothetical protein
VFLGVFLYLVFWNQFECGVRICALPFLSSLAHVPLWFFLILCFLESVWCGVRICAPFSFSSLAHVPLGFLILCFGISLFGVGGLDLRSLSFSSLAHVFPWGFDLVFWNQFSVGSGYAHFPFPLAHVPLWF